MANPRKFSEKIAMHTQKQAEETAAFDRIMQEVSRATIVQVCFCKYFFRYLNNMCGSTTNLQCYLVFEHSG